MAAGDQFAYIEGLSELRHLLKPPDELVAEPWRQAMTELADQGAEGGIGAAPYRTGKLKSKIFARVQKRPFPMWAAVRSRVRSKGKRGTKYPRGYDYGRLLEYSPKHNHAGWFGRSVWPRLIGAADAVLTRAGNEVAKRWKG